MPRVFGGLWIALPKTPLKPAGAQDVSGMGCRFFWILFFGQAKKSISAVGPKPDIKISFTLAKHKINLLSIRVGTNTVPTLPGQIRR
ncbi:hypothetical protein BJL95_03760 [Methylomonas sp. LWB]|nr:hypothetical protein BJL95_03760 [Methylomonas sp. LWB]